MTTPPPPSIQPHGLLLGLDEDLRVVVASVNTPTMLGVPADWALDADVVDLVGGEVEAAVRRRLEQGLPAGSEVVALGPTTKGLLAGVEVDLRVHRSGSRIVLELEPIEPGGSIAASYGSARTSMSRLAQADSVEGLAGLLAGEVREATGFDRVMVHRFDELGNGTVIAEVRREDLEPFLGLRYLATGVASEMGRELGVARLVAEVGAAPVPLIPALDPDTGAPLDLSAAALRSAAPGQLEHLAQIGVTAAMSVSMVVDDVWWGLVSCHHHRGPLRPSQDARAAVEFVTQVAAQQLEHRSRAEARDAAIRAHSAVSALNTRLTASPGDVLDALFADPALLSIFGASGAAQLFDGRLRTAGVVPPEATLQRIADALNQPDRYLSSTSHLAELVPDLAGLADVAAGVLRVGTMSDRWGLWFRPELSLAMDGSPAESALDVTLPEHPSFERWRNVVRGHSAPWQPWEVEAAEEIGRDLNSQLLLRSREQVAMAESMQHYVVLDRAPSFAGLELVARYRPASTYQLGGDWWDAFELGGDRVVLVVGDVAGHGVAAASAMTQVRTALRAYLFEGRSPAESLDLLDRLMDGLLDFGIATAIVAVLDRASGHVEIANAGHPAPLIVRAGGGATEVEMDVRPLLGVGEGEAPSATLDLPPDDLLVLFTDGLVERRGFDLGERTERFRRLAGARSREEDVDAWADRILDTLGTTDDDTTLLAVRRL